MKQATVTKIIGAGKKEDRQQMDFYPTPRDVTIALMDFLKLPVGNVWEPACGDGAMAKVIKRYGHEVYATDIRETGYEDHRCDFLTEENDIGYDAIITNPPFNLADQFIIKSLTLSPIVCMLLKSQYWHAAGRTALFNKYPPAYVMPLTWRPDFLGGGGIDDGCIMDGMEAGRS